jgi:hypothetical protein
MEEKTMTNKKIWLGILVIVLVFGMTVVGCGSDPDNGNGNGNGSGNDSGEPHKVTITGISDFLFFHDYGMNNSGGSITFKDNSYVAIMLFPSSYKQGWEAIGYNDKISNGSTTLTFSLTSDTKTPWSKSNGSYYIVLSFNYFLLNGYSYNYTLFHYTDGKSGEELGIESLFKDGDYDLNMPKYTITGKTTTIDFSKFRWGN